MTEGDDGGRSASKEMTEGVDGGRSASRELTEGVMVSGLLAGK